MKKYVVCILLFLLTCSSLWAAETKVLNCDQELTFNTVPQRVVVHDINMAEMAFALGLQEQMVGVTGITGWYKVSPAFQKQRGQIPELAPKYPGLENLLAVSPDLFIAGWYYGMKPGGEVTPTTLASYGIKTLILSESCIHTDKKRPAASMDLLYGDILRLGAVFGKQETAEKLVADWKDQLSQVKELVAKNKGTRVFLFDSGEEKPFTAGKYAITTAMIEAAGGENIMKDMETSWGRSSWEVIGARDPEFLILLDYQNGTGAKGLMDFLKQHPIMRHTTAVKEQRFIPLRYEELTPGPANIKAIIKMAKKMNEASE